MKNDDETDYDRQMNVEVKSSRLLAVCVTYHGRCLWLPTSVDDVYCPPGKYWH